MRSCCLQHSSHVVGYGVIKPIEITYSFNTPSVVCASKLVEPAGIGVFGVSAMHVTLEEAIAVRSIKEQEDRYIYQTIYSREAYEDRKNRTLAMHFLPAAEEVNVVAEKHISDI